jgi:histidinol-phosphatase (PHP family)
MARLIDTHTHSNFSPDSEMCIGDAMNAAAKLGLSGIAFTDHLDLKAPGGDTRFAFDPLLQQAEIIKHRDKADVKLFTGIELGLQPENLSDIRSFLTSCTFDTVIASIHFVDGVDPYQRQYYVEKTEKRAYGRYLELIYEMITAFPDFDILGHYDYIARYAPYKTRSILYKDFPDHLDLILGYLSANGKALEINTNTYRFRNGDTPVLDHNILKRFRELGGEFISIGSDAHAYDRVGEQFEFYINLIESSGFRYITHFDQRRAVPQKV